MSKFGVLLAWGPFKRAVSEMGLIGTEDDLRKLFDHVLAKEQADKNKAASSDAASRGPPKQTKSISADYLATQVQTARSYDDVRSEKWDLGGAAVALIFNALHSKKISLFRLLRELDPNVTGRVLFHSVATSLSRALNLSYDEVKKIHPLLIVDRQGMVNVDHVTGVVLREHPRRTGVSKKAGGDPSQAMKDAELLLGVDAAKGTAMKGVGLLGSDL